MSVEGGLYGNDRFWTKQYFPGLPSLGTREVGPSGAVWNGPISNLTVTQFRGPI